MITMTNNEPTERRRRSMSITPSEAKRLGDTDADVLTERRRRSMSITPGEAQRPGAGEVTGVINKKQPYVPPTLTSHRVETEGVIAGVGSGLKTTMGTSSDWKTEQTLGEDYTASDAGDIWIPWDNI
jgi:hypothetical protein